jgi:asparagine synthase (glutamine-hydrolysing)
VTRDHISAVGDVRLDNRSSVARGSGIADNAQTDLELVVAGYLAIGRALIPTLQGDFAFVLWDERTSEATAVRDAIGVKRLFYEAAADFVRFSSSLSSLATARKVNQEFVASYLVGGLRKDAGSTIWTGYRSVPPGSYEIWSLSVTSVSGTGRRMWLKVLCPRTERAMPGHFSATSMMLFG